MDEEAAAILKFLGEKFELRPSVVAVWVEELRSCLSWPDDSV